MTAPIGLRIGAKIRVTKGDHFVDVGMTGVVVNTFPPKPHAPPRARIDFDNDTTCVMDATDFEVIPTVPTKAQQPTVMAPFGVAS